MARNEGPLKAEDLSGLYIYHDHRKTVYQDFLTKDGYIITNRDVETYSRYSLRLPLAIMASCVVMIFATNLLIAIGVFVLIEVGMYILMRVKFLPKLPVIENYKHPKRESLIESQAKAVSKRKCIVFISLSAVLVLLSGFQVFTATTTQMFAFNIILAVAALALVIFYTLVLIKMHSNNSVIKEENKDAE